MARHDPAGGLDFQFQKYDWIAQALERLPVAIGLIDEQGRFLALMGSLRYLFGPVIPTRAGDVGRSWQIFDDEGNRSQRSNCPFERTLLEGSVMHGVDAIYMAQTDQERRVRLYSAPFIDGSGQSAALVFVCDVALERQAQDRRFELMQQRFVDTLVMTIRQMAEGNEGPAEAQTRLVQTLGFAGLGRKIPDVLSPREEEVLRLMAWGNSRKQIGAQLGIAVKTVEFHRSSAARKLDLKSRVDVVRYAIERGWMNVGS